MSDPYAMDDDAFANLRRLLDENYAATARELPEIKLTQEQHDKVRQTVPYWTDMGLGPITHMHGIPVVIVDSEEESSLFEMTWGSLVRRLEGKQR